jgi:hypothetical protein
MFMSKKLIILISILVFITILFLYFLKKNDFILSDFDFFTILSPTNLSKAEKDYLKKLKQLSL